MKKLPLRIILTSLFSLTNLIIISLLFLCASKQIFSQQLLSGQLILNNPSPFVSDWESNSSMAILTINNSKRTMRANVEVLLKKDGNNISSVLTGNIKQILGPPQPGVPVTSNYRSDNIASWGNLSLTGAIGEHVLRTGRLPEGNYEVCIDIKETDAPDPTPATLLICSSFNILEIQAPRLIVPKNESAITIKNPTFQWTPIIGISVANYRLKIVEVLQTQSPEQAINNTAFFETNNKTAALTYPISANAFKNGINYAWQVQALDRNGNGLGNNNGISEVFTFIYGEPNKIFTSTYPKILLISCYRITVEKWDTPSKSKDNKLLSGYGMTKLCCSDSTLRIYFSDIIWDKNQENKDEVILTDASLHF